jgi:hypothetical protein
MTKRPIACVREPCANHGASDQKIDFHPTLTDWLYRRKPNQVYLSPERHP